MIGHFFYPLVNGREQLTDRLLKQLVVHGFSVHVILTHVVLSSVNGTFRSFSKTVVHGWNQRRIQGWGYGGFILWDLNFDSKSNF